MLDFKESKCAIVGKFVAICLEQTCARCMFVNRVRRARSNLGSVTKAK